MAKINLLPSDLGPSASVLKFINLAKKASVVIGIVFFIFGTLFAGYIVFLRMEIKASAKRSEGFKTSIANLEATEQNLFFLKERAGKIKSLMVKETEEKSLSGSGSLLLNPQGATLTQAVTSLGKISISGNSSTTGSLNTFFESILSDNNYKDIKLTSFSFNAKTGYVFGLDLYLK